MKVEEITSMGDAEIFVEGCLSDFEAGISTKEEFMENMAEYTLRIVEIAQHAMLSPL